MCECMCECVCMRRNGHVTDYALLEQQGIFSANFKHQSLAIWERVPPMSLLVSLSLQNSHVITYGCFHSRSRDIRRTMGRGEVEGSRHTHMEV